MSIPAVKLINPQVVFDYSAQPKEWVDACSLCERKLDSTTDHEQDRYGYRVGVERCDCGMVFLNPRMTKAAYSDFYASGAYRRLVSAYHGREINAHSIKPEQRAYGLRLAWLLENAIPENAKTVLDVGGSTGEVAKILKDTLNLSATILDPSPRELNEVREAETIRGLIEDVDLGERRWDVVTVCQTIDHLLDPLGALRKLHDHIMPGGVLWVDALDYGRTDTLKVDHPHNFTARTLTKLIAHAGFRTVTTSRHEDHIGVVCRPR